MATLAEIYDWFMTGKKPNQAQFWAAWGSFWNKNESIPQSAITNLSTVLNSKTENDQFNAFKVLMDNFLNLKVDKEAGKALSDQNYSLPEKEKLEGIYDWVNTQIAGATIGSTSLGSINPTTTIPATINVHGIAMEAGTYANCGGVVVPANSLAFISRIGGVWSISKTAFDLSTYQKIVDGNKINPWTAKAYSSGDQVSYLGKDWVSNAATVAGDVPGTSTNWIERLSGYVENNDLKPYLKFEEGFDSYALAIVDLEGRLLGGFKIDGSFQAIKYTQNSIPGSALALNSISGANLLPNSISIEKLEDSIKNSFPNILAPETGYSYVVVDSNDRILFGVKNDGSFKAVKFDANSIDGTALKDNSISPVKLDPEVRGYFPSTVSSETGYSYVVVDSNDRILFGVKNDGTFVATKFAYFLADSSVTMTKLSLDLQAKINAGGNNLNVVCYGDSLTAGAGGGGTTYPSTLQSLLGVNYAVINCGVGGENVPTIVARQGGVPALITLPFTLPADTSTVEISSDANIRMKNILYNSNVKVLIQGEGNSVNPCYVQDIECTLSYNATGGIYSIKRNIAATSSKNIVANSPIIFSGSKKHRKPFALVIYIGQNGGYTSDAELVDYYKRMIDFSGCDNYILIGMHSGSASSRASVELAMLNAFGTRFLNWREYVSNYGLIDAGLTPTTADTTAMASGSIPPQLLYDSVHLTATGYTLLGTQIYKRFKELGYIS